MSNIDVIRAWKDEKYRNSLSKEQRSLLPANPAGMIDLTESEMEAIAGGVAAKLFAGGQPVALMTSTANGEICCSSGDLAPCKAKVILGNPTIE